MSSVEEICDHITLINKSHNILSGKVDDIRREHGGNIFSVQYKGDGKALVERLQGVCEVIENEESVIGFSSLKLHIERNEDIRSVVSLLNEMVELRQFTEIVPSMNDIFIRACQQE
jgi:ABC-2 type transport system ATP-binding protein